MPYDEVALKRLDARTRQSLSLCLLLLCAFFVLAAWVATGDHLYSLDQGAKLLLRDGRPDVLETPMWLVSVLGSGWVLLPVTMMGSAAFWWRRHRLLALWLPALAAMTIVALGVAKWVMNKPRPTLRGYGFPSGHVFGVTVFVIVALYLLWRFDWPPRWQRAGRLAGAAFVTAVAYSRIYVNAHWLSDVAGGALAGVAFALVVVLALDARAR